MIRCFTLVLTCLCGLDAWALDREEILSLVEAPHSRANLVPELSIYPDAREYRIEFRAKRADEDFTNLPAVTAFEKVVQGKYIVSEFTMPGLPGTIYMVVEYDDAEDIYRKWVLMPDGEVGELIGNFYPETRTISFVSFSQEAGQNRLTMSHEIHEQDGSRWREVISLGGKVVLITEGKATKIR